MFASKVTATTTDVTVSVVSDYRVCKFTGYKSTDYDPMYKPPTAHDEMSLSEYQRPRIKWSAYKNGAADGNMSALSLRVMRKFYSWMSKKELAASILEPAFKADFDKKTALAIELHQNETRPAKTQFGKPQLQNGICS